MSPETYRQMAQLEQSHWWFVARRKILHTLLQTLPLPPAPSILEVGCGTGGNLPMLQQFGPVTAVEMDNYARQQASFQGAGTILSGHLPRNLPPMPAHDLVCLFDVLEHIPDDRAALNSLHTVVKPGGLLVLTVPAYQWLFGPHDAAHHHHRRYLATALQTLAQQTGWQVCRISYFNTWLLPVVMLHRFKQRLFPGKAGSDARMPAPWLNWLLTKIFSSESRWLRHHNFLFGVSILIVLTPPP